MNSAEGRGTCREEERRGEEEIDSSESESDSSSENDEEAESLAALEAFRRERERDIPSLQTH